MDRNERNIQLEIWKGDWGLPSVDFDCLQILALIKFSNLDSLIDIKETNNPFWSKKNTLPIFRSEQIQLHNLNEIQQYLCTHGYNNVDDSLSKKDLAEIIAYSNLIKHKLVPALNYIWWVDERNYTQVIRKWYANALPFPLNFFYPGYYERNAKRYVDVMFPDVDKSDVIETTLFGDAEKCLTTLSARLGDTNPYFFGRQPSSLDAIVYGHLAPLLKAPLPSQFLQNHLKACTNLVNYCERITKQYFPTAAATNSNAANNKKRQYTNAKTQSNSTSTTAEHEEDFPHSGRNKILAGLFATCAMLTYAVLHGMMPMELELTHEDLYEDDNEQQN